MIGQQERKSACASVRARPPVGPVWLVAWQASASGHILFGVEPRIWIGAAVGLGTSCKTPQSP